MALRFVSKARTGGQTTQAVEITRAIYGSKLAVQLDVRGSIPGSQPVTDEEIG